MNSVGVPELMIVVAIVATWLVPAAAGVWALVTLYRLRVDQDAVLARLEAIERLLARP